MSTNSKLFEGLRSILSKNMSNEAIDLTCLEDDEKILISEAPPVKKEKKPSSPPSTQSTKPTSLQSISLPSSSISKGDSKKSVDLNEEIEIAYTNLDSTETELKEIEKQLALLNERKQALQKNRKDLHSLIVTKTNGEMNFNDQKNQNENKEPRQESLHVMETSNGYSSEDIEFVEDMTKDRERNGEPHLKDEVPYQLPNLSDFRKTFEWTDRLRTVQKDVFSISKFRENQLEVINCVMLGHDLFCIMPTGAGKR